MARQPHHHCSFLLLLCLLPVASMAKDLWAINCGNTQSFTATANISGVTSPINFTWEADDSYVHGGVSRTVSPTGYRIYDTLRAFVAKRPAKGCYTIPVGKDRRVLASAGFYYGNYDGQGQPPTFKLQFDANEWDVVETSMDGYTGSQAIYVTKSNATSICVARGSTGETPFISALRVSVLDKSTYDEVNPSQALFLKSRVAFGASDTITDEYFRGWSSTTTTLNISDYTIVTNQATFNSTTYRPDNVPLAALETAITPGLTPSNITITTPFLPSTPIPIHFNMYFTEPLDPIGRSGGERSFRIFRDGQLIDFGDDTVVIPPYGSVWEYYASLNLGSNSTVFNLVPTVNATLPPVISAWELFTISDLLSNGTDSRDVDGLSALQDKFETLKHWAGDPCLPSNYNWEWVTCNSDASPRITDLNLSGYGLSGGLPDFSSLDELRTIDLSNNTLTGDIPEFFAELPYLRKLNLADNDFSSIPPSLLQNSNIQLIVSGNPKLSSCTGQACSPAAAPQAQLAINPNSAVKNNSKGIIMRILVVCIAYILTTATA